MYKQANTRSSPRGLLTVLDHTYIAPFKDEDSLAVVPNVTIG